MSLFVFFCCCFIYMQAVVDQLPKRANLSAVVYL